VLAALLAIVMVQRKGGALRILAFMQRSIAFYEDKV
jgi:hypothetical protein